MTGDELQARYATLEKSNFRIAKFLNLIPGLGATDYSSNGYIDNSFHFMDFFAVHPRIFYLFTKVNYNENFVAEAFVKQGLGLYYYKKENATLEEDFFVRTKDELVPVEVKANKNRSKSLRQLISSDSYGDIHWGIKLADSNVGIEDGIYTFPYFCTFLLKRYLREKDEEKIV